MQRQQFIQNISDNPEVDVLIVGGGINGIGTFRDLALQGVRVLLVERSDFASGASAASSHMVHGGIRYLENGEFRLVREAVRERNLLLQNAPHLVRPLPTVIPIFKIISGILNAPLKFLGWLTKPAERGAVVIKLGLMMYDAYTIGKNRTIPKHRFENRKKSLERYPKLNSKIKYTATYYDGSMISPERLALEVLLDGLESSSDAMAINYMSLASGDPSAVEIKDEISGDVHSINPKVIVNAAGPWIDFANQRIGKATKFMGGTKGSHLVLRHQELRDAIGESELFFENIDGRITLIFPLEDQVLIGTSDLPIDDPDKAVCTEEEVGYFLEMLNVVFPVIKVDPSHIVYRFSGVRPLPASDATTTGQISRDHSIKMIDPEKDGEAPVLSLVGGKWTSFRAFSEQVTDKVLEHLKRSRKNSTEQVAIGGGKNFPNSDQKQKYISELSTKTGLAEDKVENLFQRYGTRASEVAVFIAENGQGEPAALADTRYLKSEIEFLVRQEHVQRLGDLVQRRTSLAMFGQLTQQSLNEIADIMADALGWSDQRKASEVSDLREILEIKHGVAKL